MPKLKPASERKQAPRPNRNPSHQNVPCYPSAKNLPAIPYPQAEEIEGMLERYDLTALGNFRAHAVGFLSALLEHLTHEEAFSATSLKWDNLGRWKFLCPPFAELYQEVRRLVDEKKALVLEDKAYKRSDKGAEVLAGRYAPSDTMHKMLLQGLLPNRYGKDQEGQAQAVQVNINI